MSEKNRFEADGMERRLDGLDRPVFRAFPAFSWEKLLIALIVIVAVISRCPIPTKTRTSRTSHASRLGSVHFLRGSSGAGNGALGGSFRPALDHVAIRTAQSRGNFRMHPERRPERSSQGARTGGQRGPRARRRRGPR